MKKLVCLTFLSLLKAAPVYAGDTEVLEQVYQLVRDEYVLPAKIEQLAVPSLKALKEIDSRIRVGDDGGRLSLYANGRLQTTQRKPENRQDAKAWAALTQKLIKAAQKASPELTRKDFEIVDTILAYGIKDFDVDSTYYPDLELSRSPASSGKVLRAYSERVMDNGILYVRLGAMNKFSREALATGIRKYPAVKGLILDLRGNPGGALKQAVEIAGMFLDGGIVASVQGKEDDSVEIYDAPDGDILGDKPIAVLIDGQTASSAEVLAGTLQEQSRAVVVGARSYGKGSVQKLTELPNHSRLALTNALVFLPSGKKVAGEGIMPDICTVGELETTDPEKIIQRHKKTAICVRQERGSSDLDIDVAHTYLQQNIKN